jgi:hypothetical protein
MAEEALVESLIADSEALVKSLEDQGDKPRSVMWHYFSDADEWRLLVAGPSFDALLPKQEALAYQKIATAMNSAGLSSLSIGQIKIVRTDYPLLTTMRFVVGTGPDGTSRIHMKDNTINGTFVKEMLVLRSA